MFSAILHNRPHQAIRDLSCSRAALVCPPVGARSRQRVPLGSFLAAAIPFLGVGDVDGKFKALSRGDRGSWRCRRKGCRYLNSCWAREYGQRSWRRPKPLTLLWTA